jgi:hypothetical protein
MRTPAPCESSVYCGPVWSPSRCWAPCWAGEGFKTAPFLIIVVLISRDRTLMGQHTNGRVSTTMGWITVALMAGAALTTLINVWPSDPRLAPAIAGQFSASLTPTADSDRGEVDGPR